MANVTLNPTQADFIADDSSFSFFTGGYKVGKTWVLVRKGTQALLTTKKQGLLAEPTYSMINDHLRPELERFWEEIGLEYIWIAGERRYNTAFGNVLLRTMDRRSALEGHNLGWFGVDEIDLLSKERADSVWRVLISKLTLGQKRYGFGTGTNEGYEFVWEWFVNKQINGYKLFTASTRENKANLPEGYIEDLIAAYDPKLVRRYVDGEFLNVQTGKVYYACDPDIHFVETLEIDPEKPLHVGMDFNVDPMLAVIFQIDSPDGIRVYDDTAALVVDEIALEPGNTPAMISELVHRYPKARMRIYPDATGNKRSTTNAAADTDIKLLREAAKKYDTDIKVLVNTTNPNPIDRINLVNRMFKDGYGVIRLYINSVKAPFTADDCIFVSWREGSRTVDDSNRKRTHALDALGYGLVKTFPICVRRPGNASKLLTSSPVAPVFGGY